jgi:hypothetical protein
MYFYQIKKRKRGSKVVERGKKAKEERDFYGFSRRCSYKK